MGSGGRSRFREREDRGLDGDSERIEDRLPRFLHDGVARFENKAHFEVAIPPEREVESADLISILADRLNLSSFERAVASISRARWIEAALAKVIRASIANRIEIALFSLEQIDRLDLDRLELEDRIVVLHDLPHRGSIGERDRPPGPLGCEPLHRSDLRPSRVSAGLGKLPGEGIDQVDELLLVRDR